MAKELYGAQVGTVIEGSVCNPVTNTLINMDTIQLAIDPYPIEVVEGNIINIHFEVEVIKEIAKGARFKVLATYEDKPGFLPCATIDNVPLGSCDYDFDKNLPGYGCRFPLRPGHYGGDFVLTLPRKIPDIVKQYLDGKINFHLSLDTDDSEIHDDSEIACIDTSLEFAR